MAKDIRKIVKEGYEKGDYVGHFRTNHKLTKLEKRFLDHLVALLPENGEILDLGCGIGIPFDKYLADHNLKITGIDVASKHIKQAKQNIPTATYIEGDFSIMDFGKKKFDAIIALYSIFHIPRIEQQGLFNRMYSLLKDSGLILMTLGTSNEESMNTFCDAPMVWSNYDPDKYRKMIDKSNFKIIDSEYEGQPGDNEYHWWILLKKK